MKKGAKSFISNGTIKAMTPKTNVEQMITDPIKSPKTSQFSSFLAEMIEKYNSGKQFPKLIIKMPTKAIEIPNFSEKNWADMITACEAKRSNTKRIITCSKLPKKLLKFVMGFCALFLCGLLNRSFFRKSHQE